MGPDRLKAFTDGVLAIIVTIMVLEIRAPHDAELTSLRPLVPVTSSYALSFVYLVTYWNNHHHLLHVVDRVTGPILWANAHLLFWLSLVPFATAWIGENHFAAVPMAVYGTVLSLAGVAYLVLQRVIIVSQGSPSVLAAAVGGDLKGRLSPLAYAIAVPLALVNPWAAGALYVAVAAIWLAPDRRIERIVTAHDGRTLALARQLGRVVARRRKWRRRRSAGSVRRPSEGVPRRSTRSDGSRPPSLCSGREDQGCGWRSSRNVATTGWRPE
jgi:uncharacterized membrane protein